MIAHDRPSPRFRLAALAVLVGALAVVSWTDVGALPRPEKDPAPPEAGDDERQKTTLQRQREVGVAMITWLTDQAASCTGTEASEPSAVADGAVDWSRCPRISHQELASILVPDYLRAVPDADGWGHPFEFCLAVDDVCDLSFAAGLRSPGRDGSWEGDAYRVGSFTPDRVDQDVVWIDGYFATWPEKDDE